MNDFDKNLEETMQRHYDEEEAKRQKFLNKCLAVINNEDAYEYLCYKASKLLKCGVDNCYRFVNYYFDNQEHFDCSFEEWLMAENGPLYRSSIRGLFPEFEVITTNKYEIAKMAREYYGVDIKCEPEWEGYGVYSFEFNFKELNKKRIDMNEFKEEAKNLILEKLGGL